MTPPSPKLLMVGMSCLDQFWQVAQFPPQQSRTPTTRYRTQGGGPAATAAVAAARLGAEVSLWSFHGEDANGHTLKDELGRYGVDVSCIPAIEGAITPVSAVLGTEAGERYIFPYRDAGLAGLGADWDVGDLASFGCVLADVRYPRLSKRVLKEAERCGTPTVGDFGDASEWSLARFVTHLIVSEECAQAVLEDTWDIAWDVERLEPALARLRQRKGQTVGITLGERGFVYDAGEGMQHIPAFPAEVVDTTGAGDVFHGAYAYALACGWTPDGCARFASGAAALACQGVGREALPKLNDVLTLLETQA